jgi:hypothetical protein
MILGKIPKKLHNSIENIVSGSPFQLKKRRSLSESSKIFLKTILDKLHVSIHQFNYKLIKKISYPREQYQHVDLFNDIPSEIRDIIVGSPQSNITRSYEFIIGSRIIRVHIMIPRSNDETPRIKTYFRNTIRLIWLWFSILCDYASCDCGKTVDIYLYLTQHYKMKPKHGPIDTIHANTAFTRTCMKHSTIQIYREEEWFKVLIHETFHTLGLDFSGMNETNNIISKNIQDLFHIQTDGLLFETYCETWATIINTMFVTTFMEGFQRTQYNYNIIIRKMENLLYLESKHALFQSSKVLQYMNVSYQDLIHPSDPESQQRLQKYQERTNVFCYYVLKSVLLFHMDEYLQWCWKNNKGSLNFVKTESNVKDFYKLIHRLYKSDLYIREHLYMETKLVKGSPEIEYESLRMTLYG